RAAHGTSDRGGVETWGRNPKEPERVPRIKPGMEKTGLMWTKATLDSIREIIRSYRIHSYPTTLLIDPDGKVISLNQTKKGQPALRGQDLLKSLDRLLPN